MKKRILTIAMLAALAVGSVASLTACGGGGDNSSSAAPETSAVETSAETTVLPSSPETSTTESSVSSKTQNEKYISHKFGSIEVSVPESWSFYNLELETDTLYFYPSLSESSTIYVRGEETSKLMVRITDDDLKDIQKEISSESYKIDSKNIGKWKKEKVNGVEFNHLSVKGKPTETGDVHELDIYAFLSNNHLYHLVFIQMKNRTEDFSDDFKKILNTIKVSPSDTSKAAEKEIKKRSDADKIIAAINSVGTVTKKSESAIKKARKAYNSASKEVQALVTNLDVLEDAEYELEQLKNYPAGMYKVGKDIPAGEYAVTPEYGASGYLEVTSDSTGSFDSIISNENYNGRVYITVNDGQYLTINRSSMCEAKDAKKADTSSGTLSEGMYKVGVDFPAGEYKIKPDTGGSGYYEIDSDSYGTFNSIISNENFKEERYVTVYDGQYLKFNRATLLLK